MTNQEAFDKAYRHLLTQMKAANDGSEFPTCLYRAKDGLMCGVGCMIPDEQYDLGLEGLAVRDVQALVPSLKGLSIGLLEDTQYVHDGLEPRDWAKNLAAVARLHGLTAPRLA